MNFSWFLGRSSSCMGVGVLLSKLSGSDLWIVQQFFSMASSPLDPHSCKSVLVSPSRVGRQVHGLSQLTSNQRFGTFPSRHQSRCTLEELSHANMAGSCLGAPLAAEIADLFHTMETL